MLGETTVDECLTLDVHEFNQEGYLDEDAVNARGSARWSAGGTQSSSIGWERTTIADGTPALRLSYTIHTGGETRDVDCCVPITYTECHFGGQRPWFLCPGSECYERVGKLHKPPFADRFLCRECHDLVYESTTRQGDPFFESVTKPMKEVEAAIEALKTGPITEEKLRKLYDAKVTFRKGARGLYHKGLGGGPPIEELPPFEEWVADLIDEVYDDNHGRSYGQYGRCEATARTTDERCKQPATGPHGKCYYHGGAPNTGVSDHA